MTNLLVKLFITDYENTKDLNVRQKYGVLGSVVGIIANILLFCGKFVAGIVSGAISITADAFNNLSDAAASIVTLIGFKIASKPADNEHPFGHGRAEYVSGLVVSMAILLMAFELAKSSFTKLIHPQSINVTALSIIILSVSIAVKLWLSVMNKSLSKKINSSAMKATAEDSRNDAVSTLAVLIGIIVCKYTGVNLDGIIGLLVAVFILFSGISAARETLNQIVGQAPDEEFVNDIKSTVLAHEMIIGIHDMIVHNYGVGRTMVSLHAEVDYKGDILEIHDEIDNIELELKSKFGCIAVIHMDPISIDDEKTNDLRIKVSAKMREIDPLITIHDFRVVYGDTHTNLIFDVVVPYTMKVDEAKLIEQVCAKVKEISSDYNAVVMLDRDVVY